MRAPAATLSAAAGILGVEAYHAGAIRAILLGLSKTTESALGPIDAVVGLISDLRDAVDGPEDTDQGIVGPDGEANIVPTDANALVYARDVPSTLSIVYLGGTDMGGFYPEGINGLFGPVRRRSLFATRSARNCLVVFVFGRVWCVSGAADSGAARCRSRTTTMTRP